jgi:hypothetical protein
MEENGSKINAIYEQFVLNIQSVELFFKKFSILALEEDKSILTSKKEYMENVLKKALGQNGFDELMIKINQKANESSDLVVEEEVEIEVEEVEDAQVVEDIQNAENIEKSDSENFTKTNIQELMLQIENAPKLQTKNFEILASSTFLILNNYFEFLFADLLTFHFTNNKNLIGEKNINISLNELKNYSNIEEAFDDFLFREVEKLLLEMTFEEIKNYFKKLDVSLSEDFINWDNINEIRERRHLVVHNNSIVNKKYISKSNNPYNLNIGDIAKIDTEYLKKSIIDIQIAGILLIMNCWGKWQKKYATDAIMELLTLTFDLLKQKKYKTAIKICEYVEKNIKPSNDDEENCIIRIKFNYCIALKKLKEKKTLEKKLDELRVGSMTPIFKIAKHILSDEHKIAISLFKQSIIVDTFSIDDYLDWPIFEDIRNDTELNTVAIDEFKENKLLLQ